MRLAFIGGSGHHYLRGLLNEPDLEIHRPVAAASDGYDRVAAAQKWEKSDELRWFDDPAEMLRTFKPDLVSIGAVYGHNGDLAAMALEQGARVVSDKPVAATWVQLERLEQLTRQTNLPLIAEFPFRADPAFRAARDAVARGEIGPVVLVTTQKSYRFGTRAEWYADRSMYGGTILWVASHGIDLLQFATGKRIVRTIGVQGNVSKPERGSMEDHTTSLFELDGGATGIVHADYLRPTKAATHGDDRLRIAGGHGVIEVRDGRCRITTNDREERDITETVSLRPVHLELLAAVLHGDTSIFSTADTLQTARTLLCARDAADRREWVSVR